MSRWDGSSWTRPGSEDEAAPPGWGEVVADPTGGVWLLTAWGVAPRTDRPRLFRFDGSTWRSIDDPGVDRFVWSPWVPYAGSGALGPRRAFLAVTPEGEAWVVAQTAVTRISPDGTIHRQDPKPPSDPVCSNWGGDGLAIVGRQVLALDRQGVVDLAGRGFTRVWQGATDSRPTEGIRALVAMSAQDLVIVPPNRSPDPAAGRLLRYREGVWEPFGPDITEPWLSRAPDGALWILQDGTLARITAGETTDVASGVVGWPVAGRDGSVWSVVWPEGSVVRYRAGAAPVEVGHPGGYPRTCLRAAGGDGSLWVGEAVRDEEEGDYYCGTVHAIAHWDGTRWQKIDLPDPAAGVGAMAVSDDGAGWAALTNGHLARYADGHRTVIDPGARIIGTVAERPGGACAPAWSSGPPASWTASTASPASAYGARSPGTTSRAWASPGGPVASASPRTGRSGSSGRRSPDWPPRCPPSEPRSGPGRTQGSRATSRGRLRSATCPSSRPTTVSQSAQLYSPFVVRVPTPGQRGTEMPVEACRRPPATPCTDATPVPTAGTRCG